VDIPPLWTITEQVFESETDTPHRGVRDDRCMAETPASPLLVRRGGGTGGTGIRGPCLLLLHGLGATGDVWRGLHDILAERWPGRWLIPDLPGHGSSPPLDRYSFGHLAAAVARTVAPDDERLVVLGHSLGGVVGIALASGWFGVRVDRVYGVGIKVAWSEQELAKARELAGRQVAVYPSDEEAISRHLRLAGLTGLVPPDSAAAANGVRPVPDGWRVALDPAAFAVGAPDMTGLLAAARCPVHLLRGEHDSMVSLDALRQYDPQARTLPGLGHNAHVEDAEAIWALLQGSA
jgi:pimeloyl-ACP methyl ester carboxylesterase